MAEFFAMGGYGWYVWMSFGVTALCVVVELAALRSRRRQTLIEAQAAQPDPPITTRSSLDNAGTA